jgi:uncharacterized protein (DUF58 family)
MWFRNISNEIKHRKIKEKVEKSFPNSKLNEPLTLSVRALRQLDRLQLNASRYLPGSSIGQRASLRRVPSVDFLDHRLYIPGDDIRFIDWKASARHEHTFIKQGNLPREVSVYILLDCSDSMGWGNSKKIHCMHQLTLALAHLALGHADTLFIIPLGKQNLPPLGPIHGKGQIPAIINFLKRLPMQGETDLIESIMDFRRTTARKGGLVYVISDLLFFEGLSTLLERFKVPAWDLVFFHILHPDEISPTIMGNHEFQDVETGVRINYDINLEAKEKYAQRLIDWMLQLENDCINHNHFYTLIPAQWDLDTRIIPHLRKLNLVVPV